MDLLDFEILNSLQRNARIQWNELSKILRISSSSTAERVKKIEETQVILGYTAILNPKALSIDITAFVSVNLEKSEDRENFIKKIQKIEEIQECHHVAGEGDYLLKIKCKNMAKLEELISVTIKGIKGVVKTFTTISMSTVKETSHLPIEPTDFKTKKII